VSTKKITILHGNTLNSRLNNVQLKTIDSAIKNMASSPLPMQRLSHVLNNTDPSSFRTILSTETAPLQLIILNSLQLVNNGISNGGCALLYYIIKRRKRKNSQVIKHVRKHLLLYIF
jgi:hypothetical protein